MSAPEEAPKVTASGIATAVTTAIEAQPSATPRWVPGFVLDLVCLVRRHKPFPIPPYSWESYGHGTRWEFCSRCGRFFGRKP